MRLNAFGKTALLLWFSAAVLAGAAAEAATVFTLGRSVSPAGAYVPGGTLDVTVRLELQTDGTPTALGLEETIPEGWTYQGRVSGPALIVEPGAGSGGLLEFAWFPLPAFPVEFTYRLAVPASSTATRVLWGEGLLRILNGGEVRTPAALTIVPGPAGGGVHSADTNMNSRVDLGELLRIIQFYNSGGYGCAPPESPTEDGYLPGLSALTVCAPHAGDYNPPDWRFSLSEMLRLIQFYNSGAYHECPGQGTEDGYCAGLP